MNKDKGATDFVQYMYRTYPEADFYNENSITVDGEPVIALYFDISKLGEGAFDTILSLDQELIDKSLSFAVRGRNDNILIVYCRDDEDWNNLNESYSEDELDYANFINKLSDKLARRKISTLDANKEIQKYCNSHKGCKYDILHSDVFDLAADKVDFQNDALRKVAKRESKKVNEDFYTDDGEYFRLPYLMDEILKPEGAKQWALDWKDIISNSVGFDAGRDFYSDFMEYADMNKEMISDLLPTLKNAQKVLLEVENVLDAMSTGKSKPDLDRLGKLADVLMDLRGEVEDALLWDDEI